MISNKHKYIFVHIPKCGGSSVELNLLSRENIYINDFAKDGFSKLTSWQKEKYNLGLQDMGFASQHLKINQYEPQKVKNYFTFSFVRNPWDRMVSEYFYIKKSRDAYCEKEFFLKTFPNFRSFVINNGLQCAWPSHRPEQIDFLLDPMTNQMVDFIGRLENFNRDFGYICQRIGFKKFAPLKKRNPTCHKKYRHYYDIETKNIIGHKFRRDIEYFKYTF